jgi:tungstate transport system permease protein
MEHIWLDLQSAFTIIFNGYYYLWPSVLLTLHVSAIASAGAAVVGLPLGVIIGIGRFRGRAVLHTLANASLGFPPVLLGLSLWLVGDPPGPLGALRVSDINRLTSTLCLIQGLLALPYIVALSASAVQALGPELPAQARLLGAGRLQLAVLAVREARIGIIAALLAGVAATFAEVGAQAVLTGLSPGNYTLVGGVLFYSTDSVSAPAALAFAIVLFAIVVVLIGSISLLQHRSRGGRYPRPGGYRASVVAAGPA